MPHVLCHLHKALPNAACNGFLVLSVLCAHNPCGAKKELRNIRYDSRRARLKKGETEKSSGGYEFRWTSADGKRHSIFATTLEKLRELEQEIVVDQHDGIKADIRALTVNDCFNLWKDLKRGIKDSTFQNHIYMYAINWLTPLLCIYQ